MDSFSPVKAKFFNTTKKRPYSSTPQPRRRRIRRINFNSPNKEQITTKRNIRLTELFDVDPRSNKREIKEDFFTDESFFHDINESEDEKQNTNERSRVKKTYKDILYDIRSKNIEIKKKMKDLNRPKIMAKLSDDDIKFLLKRIKNSEEYLRMKRIFSKLEELENEEKIFKFEHIKDNGHKSYGMGEIYFNEKSEDLDLKFKGVSEREFIIEKRKMNSSKNEETTKNEFDFLTKNY